MIVVSVAPSVTVVLGSGRSLSVKSAINVVTPSITVVVSLGAGWFGP